MGTIVEITIAHDDEERARDAMEAVFAELERIDALLSTYRPDSEVSRMNGSAFVEPVPVSVELFRLLSRSLEIGRLSNGAFDVTIGRLVDLWQLDEGGSIPDRESIDVLLPAVGYEKISINEDDRSVRFLSDGVQVDLGAIGKGYAVDRAVDLLVDRGIKSAIVDAGGDLRLVGSRPGKDYWRIGVRHPREASRLLVGLDLADTAVVTSGDYERFFMIDDKRYHHLLDRRTGYPAKGCQSVTVIAPLTADADAYATAAFVLGPEKGIELLRETGGVEGIIVDAEGNILWTDRAALKR